MIDGIIKYNFDFTPSAPLDESYFKEIEPIRKRLYLLGLVGEADGIGYGNVSQRVEDNPNSFVITGTQTGHLEDLTAKDYSLVEEYSDKEFYLRSLGAIKPSSEALTHGTIYNLSPHIGAIIHIHSSDIWNYMLDGEYLHTTKVEYGSLAMIEEVARIYQDIDPLSNPKFVMAGHQDGVMFFGRDIEEAMGEVVRVLS